jgi:Fe-S-cluster containining protein
MSGSQIDPLFRQEIAAAGSAAAQAEDQPAVLAAIERLWEGVERRAREAPEPGRTACGPGCSACCTVNVSVLTPEAVAIAGYLRRMPQDEFLRVSRSVEEVALKVRWMEDGERIRRGIGCAFLDSAGKCVIHAVRPMICRSITSTDPRRCREALDEEEGAVIMNLVHKYLWDEAFLALAKGLDEAGKSSRSRELCAAVTDELARPASFPPEGR